jgi:hypothetical protein
MMLQRLAGTIRGTLRYAAVGGACMGLLLVASTAGGQACPCAKRDLATVVKQADVIFVGRPLAATTDSASTGGQPAVDFQARFTFDVAVVLKGSTARATTVVTPVGPCGSGFVVGTDYLVIGKKQGGGLFTDACQGNVAGVDAIRARSAAIRTTLAAPASRPAPTAAP